MNNYEEYKKLRNLVKSLKVDNMILAHVMSKPLGLESQIIHDIDRIINFYNVADCLIDNSCFLFSRRQRMSKRLLQKFKDIDLNLEQMNIHFFLEGYVLDVREYESLRPLSIKTKSW